MPDISMCKNEQCPLKESCYRFKATPCEFRQTYGLFNHEDGDCKYYWELKED